ncbi:hypothetical protein MBAV_005082 [Candidatus Magnetobacterium bavaricum]|uniref:Uncharacterized protein n=1 Tax=Candidatus Magnetobacterium bavaricum TaxID=29290 RepID=A0A0F3GLK0_9BACT|nr:hypothetical protein MBAV_005082 [Candidatus Magnetobacterium bavaricum]
MEYARECWQGGFMSARLEQKQASENVTIREYITDSEGRIVAAIVDIEELRRVEELIEDLSDLIVIEERKNENRIDFFDYLKKRQARLYVQAGTDKSS